MEAALAAAMERGRTLWPAIDLPPERLAAHVQAQEIGERAVWGRGADLYLVAACAQGDPAAIAAFEKDYLTNVPAYVSRLQVSEEMLEELCQTLRVKLLADRPPRIVGYKGTGPLGAWVRVTTVRLALDLLSTTNRFRERTDADAMAAQLSEEALPEAELARARCRPLVEAAVKEAILALPDRDRAILRFHYVEGLNVDAIGTIYRVHRSSVARWLAEIRERLFHAVEEKLTLEMRIGASEFRSLVAAVREEIHLSIRRLLATAP
jgi:RNA polymerase sigma-70 factor (ECF subfamily)